MEYLPWFNELLEALAYLGRRAAGNTAQRLLERLQSNGVQDLDRFRQRLNPIGALMDRLNRQLPIPEEDLQKLFGNLSGFPYNTIGSSCLAFLLFYPMTAGFAGDLDEVVKALEQMPAERLAGLLAVSLDVADEAQAAVEMSGDEFSARVLALSVPAESKVAILDLYHRPEPVLNQAAFYLSKTIRLLRQERKAMEEICAAFTTTLQREGLEHFLTHTSSLNCRPELQYSVHPFLFGMDTNLSVTPLGQDGPVQVYCGILRGPLQAMLASSRGPEYEVYHTIKLLGDRTRFDILCFLRDRRAYGQELSARFGLSRHTIHHHMSKLLAARLVTCTVDGNRVYYTVDRGSISTLLERERELLLPPK